MQYFKKYVLPILVSFLLCVAFITPASAATSTSYDIKVLYNKAVSNYQQEEYTSLEHATLSNADGSIIYQVDLLPVNISHSSSHPIDTNQSELYVVSLDPQFMKLVHAPASINSSTSDSAWDSSYSVQAVLGFNYNGSRSNGCITYIWGNWSTNSGVSVTGRNVSCYSGINRTSWQPGMSFGYNTGFSHYGSTGATMSATLTRGGSSWYFSLNL